MTVLVWDVEIVQHGNELWEAREKESSRDPISDVSHNLFGM